MFFIQDSRHDPVVVFSIAA